MCKTNNKRERINDLRKKALLIYLEKVGWIEIIKQLTKDEQDEYGELINDIPDEEIDEQLKNLFK